MYPTAQTPSSDSDKFAVIDVYIEPGQNESNAFAVNGWVIVGIRTPGETTPASEMSFKVDVGDGDFVTAYTADGSPAVITFVSNVFVKLSPPDYAGFVNAKVRVNMSTAFRLKFSILMRKVND